MNLHSIITIDTPDLFAFSHELAKKLGVTHKELKADIREMADAYGYCLCDESYTYVDSKGREKFGYMLDKELLLALITGCDVGRIVSELMEPVEWECDCEDCEVFH